MTRCIHKLLSSICLWKGSSDWAPSPPAELGFSHATNPANLTPRLLQVQLHRSGAARPHNSLDGVAVLALHFLQCRSGRHHRCNCHWHCSQGLQSRYCPKSGTHLHAAILITLEIMKLSKMDQETCNFSHQSHRCCDELDGAFALRLCVGCV